MKHYIDIVLNSAGGPVSGATVTVRVANSTPGTGAIATIFSDDGITTTFNPVTTDSTGTFAFYVADGRYDLVVNTVNFTKIQADVEIADITQQSGMDLPAVFGSVQIANTVTSYNGVSTISNGLPALVAKADATAQQANVPTTTLYAVPANGAGTYRVSSYVVITQAATTSSTAPEVTIAYTDNDSSVGHGVNTTPTFTTNTVGDSSPGSSNPAPGGTTIISAKANTNIVWLTQLYASSGATPMQYAVHIKLEYLGL